MRTQHSAPPSLCGRGEEQGGKTRHLEIRYTPLSLLPFLLLSSGRSDRVSRNSSVMRWGRVAGAHSDDDDDNDDRGQRASLPGRGGRDDSISPLLFSGFSP